MNFYLRRFNLYLLPLLVVASACSSMHKKQPEKIGAIRIHVESPVTLPGQTQTIRLLRADPVAVVVGDDPVLTEQNLIAATVLDAPGGFALRLKFDETGSWILEQNTAANPGKHLVIFGQWGDKLAETRWLAAPLINHRIADGVLTFTPDASREETLKLAAGLNSTAKFLNTKKP